MNILIVDDDRLVSGALKMILEVHDDVTVMAIGENGHDAVALYETHQPDILLMDIRMEPMDGLEASQVILDKYPSAKILLLTTFSDDEYIVRALRLGAKGYLLKQDYDSILPALRAVYSGQTVFGREITSKIPNLIQQDTDFHSNDYQLSQREMDIITLIAEGLSNKEIASKLFLSEGTVRNYLSALLEKLSLRDRTQLAVFYYKHCR